MAATTKIQISVTISLCFVAFLGKVSLADFALTGTELTRTEDTSGHKVTLPGQLKFPFRGSLYSDLYVSKDGLVGFHPGTVHKSEIFADTLTREDPAFVSPYYFSAQDIGSNLGADEYNGKTLYRTSGSGNDVITPSELSNYSAIIQQSVVGLNGQFNASYGLAVTWKGVVSKVDVINGCGPCRNNTFQLVMLTDGSQSFAIFNYVSMNIQPDRFTQSGFNAGEGRGYTTAIPTNELRSAHQNYGSDVRGRYIYRIDTDEVQKGGCTNSAGPLTIYPRYAGMYGGKMLDIQGPCMFDEQRPAIVKCRFNNDDSLVSYGFRVNTMKARCSVPLMNVRGWIKVEMSMNNQPYRYATQVLIVFPGRLITEERVQLPDMGPTDRWNETSAGQLTLRWNKSLLVAPSDIYSSVNISLWGFKESQNGVIWQNLRSISTGNVRASSEVYTFPASSIACVGQSCDEFEVGIVKVELQNQNQATSHKYLTSSIIPLGFYVGSAMTMTYGENWPQQKCMAWYNTDKQDMSWLSNLHSCPCNLVQALTDIGRWQTDVGCDLYSSNPHKCRFHLGAVHCVRSVQPSPDGAGNQCCYDATGNLRFSADSFQGSTPDRSHAWGASPYGRYGLVPDASHWVKDVVTFYYCCLWTDYRDCDHYMDQRGTRDCTGYTPPSPAMLYGQGHIQTFDGYHQRMCGNGDFILMTTNLTNGYKVTVQGRFFENAFPQIVGERGNTSVMLSNVGVQVDGDTKESVEIRLKLPTSDRSKSHLDVLVNGHYHFFENKESRWQDFKYFAVVNNDLKGKESNFTIILQDGLGIQIADCNLTLCVLIMAPPSLKGKTEGLLGNFNGNATDDLKDLNYTSNIMLQNNQLSELQRYQMFQYPWAATKQTSVISMLLEPQLDARICSLTQPNRYLPSCQNNKECTFDYTATGDASIAMKTKMMSERFEAVNQFVVPVRTCGLLNVPRSIKNNYDYKLGQSVTVQGCRTGSLTGDDFTYTCVSTGNMTQGWSPSVSASCTAVVDTADTAMIVGIVVGILAFFVILVLIGVLVRKARNHKKGKYSEGSGRNPVTEGKNEGSAYYSRPHKVPQDDVENKRSSQEYSL